MSSTQSSTQLIIEHFYLGIIMTAVYIIASPLLIEHGYPSFAALLLIEVAVLAPIVALHLAYLARSNGGTGSFAALIPYRRKAKTSHFITWSLLGIALIVGFYIVLYPLGLELRETVFSWLPEWYFNPSYGAQSLETLAMVFLAGIVIDGLIGPIAEELFFRGYLLSRMEHLKGWAPIINGAFFGLYHFWQPHNLIALVIIGIILSYIVWKTKNVYIAIVVHCAINIFGAVGGYLAVTSGIEIAR